MLNKDEQLNKSLKSADTFSYYGEHIHRNKKSYKEEEEKEGKVGEGTEGEGEERETCAD